MITERGSRLKDATPNTQVETPDLLTNPPYLKPLTPEEKRVFEQITSMVLLRIAGEIKTAFAMHVFNARIQGKVVSLQDFLNLHNSLSVQKSDDLTVREDATRGNIISLKKIVKPELRIVHTGKGYTAVTAKEFHDIKRAQEEYCTISDLIEAFQETNPEITGPAIKQRFTSMRKKKPKLGEELNIKPVIDIENGKPRLLIPKDSMPIIIEHIQNVDSSLNNRTDGKKPALEKRKGEVFQDIVVASLNTLLWHISKGTIENINKDLIQFLEPFLKKHKRQVRQNRVEAFRKRYFESIEEALIASWNADSIEDIEDASQKKTAGYCLALKLKGETLDTILRTISSHFTSSAER